MVRPKQTRNKENRVKDVTDEMKDKISTDDFSSSHDDIEVVGDTTQELPVTSSEPTAVKPEAQSNDKEELDKLRREYLYLAAEFENYKRNAIKERSDLIKYASERFISNILDVVDNFERALSFNVGEDNLENFRKGMELTQSELMAILNKFGAQKIDPLGQQFDPTQHEAISSEPTNQFQPGQICKVFRSGYKLHDKLIRPAQVVVAVAPSE